MGLWSNTAAAASRPKNYSEDGNASGNNGALKDIVTNEGGWALAPGLAASGNDNTDANPEILIAISGLQGGVIGGTVNVRSIGWTDGAYADGATFDITVNFEEPVDITSAAATEDQVLQTKHTFYCLEWVQQIWYKTTQLLLSTILVLEPTH